jgi:hypothetical protein
MRIDLQIPAHLDKEVAANLFLSVLEGGEFFTEIQTAMASLSLVGHECTIDLLLAGEPTEPTLEFRTRHNAMVGQFCPRVKRVGPQRTAEGGEGQTALPETGERP